MTRAQKELAATSAPLLGAAACAAAGAWGGSVVCMLLFVGALGAVAWRWRA